MIATRGPGIASSAGATAPSTGTKRLSTVSAAAHPPKPPATFPKPASAKGPSPVPGQGSKAGSAVAVAVTKPAHPKRGTLEDTNRGHATQLLGLEKEIEGWKSKVCSLKVAANVDC